jgi:hypothetical protein
MTLPTPKERYEERWTEGDRTFNIIRFLEEDRKLVAKELREHLKQYDEHPEKCEDWVIIIEELAEQLDGEKV